LAKDTRWISVSAAKGGIAAIRNDGVLWLWGSSLPAKHVPDALGWTAVALVSAYQGYAIRRDGSFWEVTMADRAPQRRGTDSDWSSVSADDSGALVRKKDGSLWYPDVVWHGEKSEDRMQRIGTASGWGTSFVHVDRSTVAAVKQNGTVWIRDLSERETEVRLGKEANWKSLAPSSDGLLGLDSKGRLAKFDGDAWSTIGVRNDWIEVSARGGYVLALKSDGTLWSWREANPDEDRGPAEGQPTPVRVGRDSNWLHVASGGRHAAAIKTDGTLWTWGDNSEGQLGLGSETRRTKPALLIRE
jgi:alpha-tubulin suppressor-like RCC1 family protein